jgi:hypothetical protein
MNKHFEMIIYRTFGHKYTGGTYWAMYRPERFCFGQVVLQPTG